MTKGLGTRSRAKPFVGVWLLLLLTYVLPVSTLAIIGLIPDFEKVYYFRDTLFPRFHRVFAFLRAVTPAAQISY